MDTGSTDFSKPTVAIVGRPNVGKSSIFNRLVGSREAITSDVPGTTRDRKYGDCMWRGISFRVIDTAGLGLTSKDSGVDDKKLDLDMVEQIDFALNEAEVILFVVDGRAGLTAEDKIAAHKIRKSDKSVIIVVNKVDSVVFPGAEEFLALGLGEPYLISAIHGRGVGDLLDSVVARFKKLPPESLALGLGYKIAIIGRPNVGKSTLLNELIGGRRAVVSDKPGTTRDTVDITLQIGQQLISSGRPITLIDTAGIRRRGKIQKGIERYALIRALRAVDRSDLVLLVVDGSEGLTRGDAHLAAYAQEGGKKVIVVINKADLFTKNLNQKDQIQIKKNILSRFPFMARMPSVVCSAKDNINLDELWRGVAYLPRV